MFLSTIMPKSVFKLVLVALGLIAVTWMFTASPAWSASQSMGNQAEQQVTLTATPETVFAAASEAFQQWNRGELITSDPSTMTVTGLSRTNFFKFTDDITVQIQALENSNQAQIFIKSVGRLGEYDFGGNQRNIDEYLAALRSLLGSS